MKLSALVGLALIAPSSAIRKGQRKHTVANNVDCSSLAGLVVDGKNFGLTIEELCKSWPARFGEFPVNDINRARELLGKVMNPGGAWDQIKQIRADKEDRGFCWRNTTVRAESGDCPLGYRRVGLTGNFIRSCNTGCMWSTHPISCGFGCATTRDQCNKAVIDQSFVVAQGVASVYGFVTGDDRIGRAVAAIIKLAEFMLETMPPIVDAINGAIDIFKNNEHGAYVAVIFFQYLQETAPDVRVPAEAIRDAIKEFGDVIKALADEKKETGKIDPRSVIDEILSHGESMLDWAVKATKVFTHPTCAITDNVAFTVEVAGDDRLLGPWIQRGEIEGHPRYTLLGDRNTNLEWSTANGLNRWALFSDNWSGFIGRRFLYESVTRSLDYPMGGWKKLQGVDPAPEFVPVEKRLHG